MYIYELSKYFVASRQVSSVGITSLGIDHTSLLGSTIEDIAWQKAGIMKPGSIAFTVDQQPAAALEVLKQRASEKKVRLSLWEMK
jgi:folylpolyglutamate synthase